MSAIVLTEGVEAESQVVLSAHGKSFRWAQTFLDEKERGEAAVVYAFCRKVDDSVDEAPSRSRAESAIERIRAMLLGAVPADALTERYVEIAERRGFGLEPALDLLRGVESDLGFVRLSDDRELSLYCYRVAGTVGLMMAGLLGVTDPAARRPAVSLGMAMQLTNICRDVREDADRGRVYLPSTRFEREGVPSSSLIAGAELARGGRVRASVQRVVGELLDLAEDLYAEGERGFRYLPWRARFAIAVASSLYRGIGRKLRARGGDPWDGRVRLTVFEKFFYTAEGALRWLRTTFLQPRERPSARLLPSPWLREEHKPS